MNLWYIHTVVPTYIEWYAIRSYCCKSTLHSFVAPTTWIIPDTLTRLLSKQCKHALKKNCLFFTCAL